MKFKTKITEIVNSKPVLWCRKHGALLAIAAFICLFTSVAIYKTVQYINSIPVDNVRVSREELAKDEEERKHWEDTAVKYQESNRFGCTEPEFTVGNVDFKFDNKGDDALMYDIFQLDTNVWNILFSKITEQGQVVLDAISVGTPLEKDMYSKWEAVGFTQVWRLIQEETTIALEITN